MNSNAHGPFMSIPSIAISVHRLPICKNCGNSSAKSAMSTSVCFKARSFCAHSHRLEIVSGIICSCVKPFQVATARTHTRHRPDFLLHRSTEDWDISKCYNMFYADLFAFVITASTSFLRSTGAITFGVFEEKISDQPVRDYFDAQLGLSCHVIPKEPPHWMGK